MKERQAGEPSVPKGHVKTATRCTLSAVCKEAVICLTVGLSKPTGLPTELGFWWPAGHKKLVEGPKPPLG